MRKNKRLKASIVATERGGIVTSTFEGKVAWDDMIQTPKGRYLDYLIVDINAH